MENIWNISKEFNDQNLLSSSRLCHDICCYICLIKPQKTRQYYVENYVENAAALVQLVRTHVEGRVFEFRSQHKSGSDIAERYATAVYVTGPRRWPLRISRVKEGTNL